MATSGLSIKKPSRGNFADILPASLTCPLSMLMGPIGCPHDFVVLAISLDKIHK